MTIANAVDRRCRELAAEGVAESSLANVRGQLDEFAAWLAERRVEEGLSACDCNYETRAVRRFNFVRKITSRIGTLRANYDFLAGVYIVLEALG